MCGENFEILAVYFKQKFFKKKQPYHTEFAHIILAKMRNTHPLLLGVKTYIAVMKITEVCSQKTGNRSVSRFSYITLWHISKGLYILLHKACSSMFFASLLKIARNWEELRFSSMEERKKKIWQVYTMENYS